MAQGTAETNGDVSLCSHGQRLCFYSCFECNIVQPLLRHYSSLLMCPTGQSDTDTSDCITPPDSQQDAPSAVDPVVMVTPDLMAAHCDLLTNLLAILPDFTLTALRHNQLLQALAG